MSSIKKRSYNSGNRSAQAEQTRKRILTAAKDLFRSVGFEGVTIEKLAQAAEVSSPTIYSIFQSKRGVLLALMDDVLPLEEIEEMVEKGKKEKSPAKRMAVSAKIARRIYDLERAEMEFYRSASVLAPEFKELENEREKRRYTRQEETVKRLFQEGLLLDGLDIKKARDILWALTGRDLYRMLVVDRGWSSEEYEKWLAQLLAQTLIKN